MAAPQQGPSKEFAVAYRDFMLQSLTNEMATTKKVHTILLFGFRTKIFLLTFLIPDSEASYFPSRWRR